MKNIFTTFQKMSDENKDIRLAPFANITGININGTKATITIGVDVKTALDLANKQEEFYGGFLVANKKQADLINNN